jgi:phosphoribosylpyrophosphate synthetase
VLTFFLSVLTGTIRTMTERSRRRERRDVRPRPCRHHSVSSPTARYRPGRGRRRCRRVTVTVTTSPPLDAFVVRKEAKAHGLQRRIEGPDVTGRRCLVVEDTSTTGGSPLTAVQALREAGADVVGVATIVDRATGAGEKIAAEGLDYRYAYGLSDLGLT